MCINVVVVAIMPLTKASCSVAFVYYPSAVCQELLASQQARSSFLQCQYSLAIPQHSLFPCIGGRWIVKPGLSVVNQVFKAASSLVSLRKGLIRLFSRSSKRPCKQAAAEDS